jgi:hypothetical protein
VPALASHRFCRARFCVGAAAKKCRARLQPFQIHSLSRPHPHTYSLLSGSLPAPRFSATSPHKESRRCRSAAPRPCICSLNSQFSGQKHVEAGPTAICRSSACLGFPSAAALSPCLPAARCLLPAAYRLPWLVPRSPCCSSSAWRAWPRPAPLQTAQQTPQTPRGFGQRHLHR